MKLVEIQQLVQSLILAPETVSMPKADASEDKWIQEQLLESNTMTAKERLAIYRDMFQTRVIDSLIDDYPLTHQILEEEVFSSLCLSYIQRNPSRTYTLEKIGDNFAGFVAEQHSLLNSFPFVADLAQLEFALVKAFHADEPEVLTSNDMDPTAVDSWLMAKLSPVPSASLLCFAYDVNGLYSEYLLDSFKPVQDLPVQQSYVLIWKYLDANWRLSLDSLSHQFLAKLFAGQTMAAAVDHLLTLEAEPEKLHQVFEAFRMWIAEGVFCKNSLATLA